MNPEEIKAIIENTIDNKIGYYWVYIILSGLTSLLVVFLFQYVKDKGKNLATKQDVADITKKIEEVKTEFQNKQEVESQKKTAKV